MGYFNLKFEEKPMPIPDSPILKAIHERRSVREFTDAAVVRDLIMTADEKCLDSFEKSTH